MNAYCQFCRYKTFWGGCYNDTCVGGNRFEAVITPEKFAKEMIQAKTAHGHDPEVCHCVMDEILCKTLCKLGYDHGVKAFNDSEKYYM